MSENYISHIFNGIIGLFGVGSFAFFLKSKAKKKAEDGSSIASTVKEWTDAFRVVTEPLSSRIELLEKKSTEQQKEIIELSIQVGVLARENDRKDLTIMQKDERIKELELRIKELELI